MDLDKLIDICQKLEELNGKKINITDKLGSTGESMDLPLKDRGRQTAQDAENRYLMEKATRGEAVDPEKIDEIVDEFIREKIFKNFFGDK